MFKFKGISSKDMQVVIEEEEHFIARAARRYETTEIEGRDGAIFEELGYSYVERPIYVQCLNVNKIDNILAWLDGEGEFEYKGRKTTARFYSELEPQREGYIRIIDTTFIRDPFWTKLDDEYIEVKGRKDKTTEKSSNINVKDSSDLNAKVDVYGISKQEMREGYNLFNNTKTISNVTYNSEEDKWIFNLPNRYDHIAQKGTFFKNIKANTNYTLYFNILKNTSSAAILFNLTNTIWNNNVQISAGQTGVVVNNIKTREDLSTALYDLWFSHLNTITGEFEAQIMLLEGTYTSENIPDYEQYGASPSPEFPSNIENVTGDIDIKIYNKNLLDLTKCGFSNCVKNEDGSVRSNINNGYYATITTSQLNDFILQNKGRSLTFSFEGISTKTIGFYIPCKRANSDSDYFETTKTGNSITMQIPEDLESLSYIQIRWNRQATPFTDTTTVINNIQLELNDVKTDFVEHKEQLITFPLAEGQKMYDGDCLASDGIHHKRTQVEFDGTENWRVIQENIFWMEFSDTKLFTSAIMTHFKYVKKSLTELLDNEFTTSAGQGHAFWIKKEGMTLEEFKSYLAQQKQAGIPVILEYELEEEEIEPYTEEQQEAYNQLQNVLSYKTVTNVFTNQGLLEFKYIEDTTEKITNEGSVYSRPILRLEKTICNEVDIMIEDVRFQYDFNDEEYVEIDCEEKEVKYEGLNRNRKIQIGYEFPKLKVGENKIKMYGGDCIIKAKRKDRWL